MRQKLLAVLLVLPLALLIGCADPYGACAKAGADIASGIAQGMSTVAGLQAQGVISKTEEANVLGYLEFANQQDESFLTCATAAHTAGGVKGSYTTCVAAFASTLNNPSELTLIRVNNPSAQENVQTIVNGISTAVAAINTALGGK